jgi:hypothetical protein
MAACMHTMYAHGHTKERLKYAAGPDCATSERTSENHGFTVLHTQMKLAKHRRAVTQKHWSKSSQLENSSTFPVTKSCRKHLLLRLAHSRSACWISFLAASPCGIPCRVMATSILSSLLSPCTISGRLSSSALSERARKPLKCFEWRGHTWCTRLCSCCSASCWCATRAEGTGQVMTARENNMIQSMKFGSHIPYDEWCISWNVPYNIHDLTYESWLNLPLSSFSLRAGPFARFSLFCFVSCVADFEGHEISPLLSEMCWPGFGQFKPVGSTLAAF